MTSRKTTASLLCSALLLALFASGCQQDAAREAEEASATDTAAEPAPAVETKTVEPPPPPTPVPGTDAAIVEDRSTPVAAVRWATTADQDVLRTTLTEVADQPLAAPSVIVVGAVAGLDLRPHLATSFA